MRRIILMVLVASLYLFAACSYMTDFVIVNESDGPITIRYEVKNYPGPFSPPEIPGTMPASELSSKGSQRWTPSQYELDETSRSVTTRLMPGQALRIATLHHYVGHKDPNDAQNYPISRIMVSGARGELSLAGEQARTTFSKVSAALYTLTYK
jgi:hypothetical protein